MGKTQDKLKTKITRRDLFKAGGLAAAAAAVTTIPKTAKAEGAEDGRRLAMVIDLQRCVGCGACIFSCKNENNVQDGVNFSYKHNQTVGEFPNVRYEYLPTLCNHCENAPCVGICPTGAMHKTFGNITMHDPETCIGCRLCMGACPYTPGVTLNADDEPEDTSDESWGVIHFNEGETHGSWRDGKPIIAGATSTPAEVTKKANAASTRIQCMCSTKPDMVANMAAARTAPFASVSRLAIRNVMNSVPSPHRADVKRIAPVFPVNGPIARMNPAATAK